MTFKCFASCAFGIESLVAMELKQLGFENVETKDARVYFLSDEKGIAKANLWLRCADRVYIEIKAFEAITFDELFECVKAVDWEHYIPKDAAVPVNADSVKSRLFSVSDIQSVGKKAVAERLMKHYHLPVLTETGARYDVHLKVFKDVVSVCMNVSGPGLNRRGYRKASVRAPVRETLAAALVMLTRWQDGDFCDPMCGSGTIAIEASMIGTGMAPGLLRPFDGEKWRLFKNEWKEERMAAQAQVEQPRIVLASDIDREALRAAEKNAKAAGVDVRFHHEDIRNFSHNNATVLTNPPYAERMGEKESVHQLYRDMGKALAKTKRKFIITADDEFERYFGTRAEKKRKLYNGNIRCTLYQYF